MPTQIKGTPTVLNQSAVARETRSRIEILIGTGFFLLYPLGFLLTLVLNAAFGNTTQLDSIAMKIISTFLLSIVGGILVILIFGWIKGFPRWCYPYWIILISITILLMHATTPGLWILGYTMSGQDFWGWRAWIPLATVIVLSLALTRSWQPLFNGIVDLWNDWTRLSFCFYGFLPLLIFIMYDEVQGEDPFVALLWCILAIGAFGYMRAKNTWLGILALLTSTIFCLSASVVFLAIYWDGRIVPELPQPVDGWQNAQSMITGSINYIILLISPVLIGIVRGTINRLRPASG